MNTKRSLLDGKDAPLTKLPKTFPVRLDDSLSLGLDIGVGSCGQALVFDSIQDKGDFSIPGIPDFPDRIAYLGVRAFDVPEIKEKTGLHLKNPTRREKRRARLTTRRRAWRIWEVKRLFCDVGLLPEKYPLSQSLWKYPTENEAKSNIEEWRLFHARMTEGSSGVGRMGPLQNRVRALDEALDPLDWAAALLHIAKHRGFKSNSKSEKVDDEGGKILTAIQQNKIRMESGDYRTVGEMLLKHPDFKIRKRNRDGQYLATIARLDQEKEIRLLFEKQRSFGNPFTSEAFENDFLELFNQQRPLQNSYTLLGDCPFEKNEKRGPRMAPSFELSRFLQKLNTLSLLLEDGRKVRLVDYLQSNDSDIKTVIQQFGESGTQSNPGRFSWADLRKLFELPKDSTFPDLPAAAKKKVKVGVKPDFESSQKIEKEDFVTRNNNNGTAKGSFLLRSVLGEDLWKQYFPEKIEQLDYLAEALTFFEQISNHETSERHWGVLEQLRFRNVDEVLIEAVENDLRSDKPLLARFTGSVSISMLASRKLIPQLIQGQVYSDACAAVYGSHNVSDFSFSGISNPVVKSVVQECLKQVIHLIDVAGRIPGRICVELSRDMGKSISERNEMHAGIEDRTKHKNSNRKNLKDQLGRVPGDDELLKYELWLEQGDCCPYCGETLGKEVDIVETDYEIDHILPRSRSHDNSYHNKILVHRKCNRDKKNCTPFEFSSIGNGDPNSEGWLRFNATVGTMKGLKKQKRRNLLNTSFAEDEIKFASRHLNDTRYISRLVKHYLELIYEISENNSSSENKKKRRVFVQPGSLTALVRKSWGLENLKKDEAGNRLGDKHHAVDALVCALLSEGQRQFITRVEQGRRDALQQAGLLGAFSESYRTMELKNDHHRIPRQVKAPWDNFRNDVEAALKLFTVSRREIRKGTGKLHDETNYRVEMQEGRPVYFVRKSLVDSSVGKGKPRFSSEKDIENIKDIHEDSNRWLKEALLSWISQGAPVNEEALPRDPSGNIVRKVTVIVGNKSGRKYPQGYVVGGMIIRVDVFSKVDKKGKKKYYLVPVYTYHLKDKEPPFRAIVASKDEKDWDLIDSSYKFEFSLWKNSRVEIEKNASSKNSGQAKIIGLYKGINRNTAKFEIDDPDDSTITNGVSVKVNTKLFTKMNIDRLGRTSPVRKEKRTWRGKNC